jgi:hypothetical protein
VLGGHGRRRVADGGDMWAGPVELRSLVIVLHSMDMPTNHNTACVSGTVV